MKLSEVISESSAEVQQTGGDADISRVASDSRNIKPGDLFVCMPSTKLNTADLAPDAVKAGATAVLAFDPKIKEMQAVLGVPVLFVPREGRAFEEAVWRLAHSAAGWPSRSMKAVGVTGTNGKTTTAWLLAEVLEEKYGKSAYLGTLGYRTDGQVKDVGNTTPFAPDLAQMLRDGQDSGIKAIAMEVSSHALEERRADGVEFDAAVFTNLTQDHLDFHETMEAYESAKKRLFFELPKQSSKDFIGALNLDDPVGEKWAKEADFKVIGYSLKDHPEAALRGHLRKVELTHIELELTYEGETTVLSAGLGGLFNASNLLSAAAGALAVGCTLEEAVGALGKAVPVPGRFESIPNELGIGVVVDYAHTPDALIKLLQSIRDLEPRRIITVFGCGGDRDRTKRPKMAAAACENSNLVVLTSDNPRTEDPIAIIQETAAGLNEYTRSELIVDRPKAIFHAIAMAREGDVVVIAGKGHEDYQIIGTVKHPMDDRKLARQAISSMEAAKRRR